MPLKERLDSVDLKQNQDSDKDFDTFKKYFEELSLWRDYTLEFINSPIDMDGNIFNFKEYSTEIKAKMMSIILIDHKSLEAFYIKARKELHKKTEFKTSCVSYATFVSTFSQWMDPKNTTELNIGIAKISESPRPENRGKICDHFWTNINGQIFDNSTVDQITYTNYVPILKVNDLLCEELHLEPVNQTQQTTQF
jgi:hypothetical protein